MRVASSRPGPGWAVCALFALLLAAPRAHAATELGLSAGSTFRVNGEPGSGGASISSLILFEFVVGF